MRFRRTMPIGDAHGFVVAVMRHFNRTDWRGYPARSACVVGVETRWSEGPSRSPDCEVTTTIEVGASGDLEYVDFDGNAIKTEPLYGDIEFNDIDFGEEVKDTTTEA